MTCVFGLAPATLALLCRQPDIFFWKSGRRQRCGRRPGRHRRARIQRRHCQREPTTISANGGRVRLLPAIVANSPMDLNDVEASASAPSAARQHHHRDLSRHWTPPAWWSISKEPLNSGTGDDRSTRTWSCTQATRDRVRTGRRLDPGPSARRPFAIVHSYRDRPGGSSRPRRDDVDRRLTSVRWQDEPHVNVGRATTG